MSFTGDAYGKRTLDFVERLRNLTGYGEICRDIKSELDWFGLTCVTAWSMPAPGRPPDEGLVLNTRPQDYVEHYIEKNYVVRDPVLTQLRRTLRPFSWSEVREQRELSKSEKSIMDEARDFGARDGLIIPIVTLSGSVSVFSPCGLEPNLSQRARAALEIVGMCGFNALKTALTDREQPLAAHRPLSPREREIMQWVATGKTDDEIADLLSLRRVTVTWHVENAKHKLNAVRRTYAVVQALRSGEISL
jgi:LuxR family quorum sensing-dependent transcriptional regulator